ncbi:MAG: homoserine dehydrogenase [Clostridiales bacterium]|nr:homoserine dehydrogenase [Clostridiales bacterium]
MKVAIMGYGVVGSGVAELLNKNRANIIKKSTQPGLDLKYILEVKDFPGDPNEGLIIKDFETILNDSEVGIVVETMGGMSPAYEYTLACLKAGKSVVTSNKEVVAAKGYELLKVADQMNVSYLFEASVGGGIPIIRPINQCLAANEIKEIAGILNGTTNFILTRMINDAMSFDDALKLAQEKGYAEKDPTADVEGHDACRKICILSSLSFGRHVYPEQVYTEGITKIDLADVEYARTWGGAIKLIGRAKKLDDGRITAMVSPALVEGHSQLAGVEGVFNAILVRGDATGDVVFYGRGAGKMPTASAVVADVIDIAGQCNSKKLIAWEDGGDDYVADYKLTQTAAYIRCQTQNMVAALKEVESLFGQTQPLTRQDALEGEFAFITGLMAEKDLVGLMERLTSAEVLSFIRITDY